jgi:hypothetical protein
MYTNPYSRSFNSHIKGCYCVCHSPWSSRPVCEHCVGDSEVAREYQKRLRNSLLTGSLPRTDDDADVDVDIEQQQADVVCHDDDLALLD